MRKELKKCPFCGGEATTYADKDDIGEINYGVMCKNTGCCTIPTLYSKETAIRVWNTRKPIDAVVKQLEEKKLVHKRLINYEAKMGTIAEKMQHEKAVQVLDKVIEIVKDNTGL